MRLDYDDDDNDGGDLLSTRDSLSFPLDQHATNSKQRVWDENEKQNDEKERITSRI